MLQNFEVWKGGLLTNLTIRPLIAYCNSPIACAISTIQYAARSRKRWEDESLIEHSLQKLMLIVESFDFILDAKLFT